MPEHVESANNVHHDAIFSFYYYYYYCYFMIACSMDSVEITLYYLHWNEISAIRVYSYLDMITLDNSVNLHVASETKFKS